MARTYYVVTESPRVFYARFFDAVQKRPALWNQHHDDFDDDCVTWPLWKEVAKIAGLGSRSEARNNFLAKRRGYEKFLCGKIEHWSHFNVMSFLGKEIIILSKREQTKKKKSSKKSKEGAGNVTVPAAAEQADANETTDFANETVCFDDTVVVAGGDLTLDNDTPASTSKETPVRRAKSPATAALPANIDYFMKMDTSIIELDDIEDDDEVHDVTPHDSNPAAKIKQEPTSPETHSQTASVASVEQKSTTAAEQPTVATPAVVIKKEPISPETHSQTASVASVVKKAPRPPQLYSPLKIKKEPISPETQAASVVKKPDVPIASTAPIEQPSTGSLILSALAAATPALVPRAVVIKKKEPISPETQAAAAVVKKPDALIGPVVPIEQKSATVDAGAAAKPTAVDPSDVIKKGPISPETRATAGITEKPEEIRASAAAVHAMQVFAAGSSPPATPRAPMGGKKAWLHRHQENEKAAADAAKVAPAAVAPTPKEPTPSTAQTTSAIKKPIAPERAATVGSASKKPTVPVPPPRAESSKTALTTTSGAASSSSASSIIFVGREVVDTVIERTESSASALAIATVAHVPSTKPAILAPGVVDTPPPTPIAAPAVAAAVPTTPKTTAMDSSASSDTPDVIIVEAPAADQRVARASSSDSDVVLLDDNVDLAHPRPKTAAEAAAAEKASIEDSPHLMAWYFQEKVDGMSAMDLRTLLNSLYELPFATKKVPDSPESPVAGPSSSKRRPAREEVAEPTSPEMRSAWKEAATSDDAKEKSDFALPQEIVDGTSSAIVYKVEPKEKRKVVVAAMKKKLAASADGEPLVKRGRGRPPSRPDTIARLAAEAAARMAVANEAKAAPSSPSTTVADLPTITEETTVAEASSSKTMVAGPSSSKTTVAGRSSSKASVAGSSSSKATVAESSSSKTTIAGPSASKTSVARSSGSKTSVAGSSSSKTTAAGPSSSKSSASQTSVASSSSSKSSSKSSSNSSCSSSGARSSSSSEDTVATSSTRGKAHHRSTSRPRRFSPEERRKK